MALNAVDLSVFLTAIISFFLQNSDWSENNSQINAPAVSFIPLFSGATTGEGMD